MYNVIDAPNPSPRQALYGTVNVVFAVKIVHACPVLQAPPTLSVTVMHDFFDIGLFLEPHIQQHAVGGRPLVPDARHE